MVSRGGEGVLSRGELHRLDASSRQERPDRVAGSCFASNLIPFLERAGFTYLRTEQPPPFLRELPENLGYRNFTAAYGNIYTARQFLS